MFATAYKAASLRLLHEVLLPARLILVRPNSLDRAKCRSRHKRQERHHNEGCYKNRKYALHYLSPPFLRSRLPKRKPATLLIRPKRP